MDFAKTKRGLSFYKYKYFNGGLGLHAANTQLIIIRLPNSRVLSLVARSVLLAFVILSLPWLGSLLPNSERPISEPAGVIVPESTDKNNNNIELLPLLFRDLNNEGLLKMGDKAAFLSSGNEEAIYGSQILSENAMDMISSTDTERQKSIPDGTFDFLFLYDFNVAKGFVDRSLKIGGIAVVQLGDGPFMAFEKPSNYKIVYVRKFDSTVMAMRKTGNSNVDSSSTHRRLLASPEAKKAALENLEDVLLEPPRSSSGKSSRYLKKTKFLPDLLGDSLESYPRRVFIDVGLPEKDEGSHAVWFKSNYPTRNLEFEMYKIETVNEESSGKEVPQIGMSDWLKKNVKEEEYVVMKSEAEVAEEMVKSKAIRLVDELFLDCKPKGKGNKSRKAYWECLALYGTLRDEGVAVHQWWG